MGEEVEGNEAAFIPHQGGEARHDLRIADVFFLRGARHFQVMAHQPDGELGVRLGEPVFAAESFGLFRADHAMISTPPLADVVEERREVEQPRLPELEHERIHRGVFVRVFSHGEAAQVAHDHQRVGIHGIGVVEVVLHLADDAPPGGDIAGEDTELVHPPQAVHDAAALAQQVEKERLVARFEVIGVVDELAVRPQQPQGAGGEVGELASLREQQEDFEEGFRVAHEDLLAHHVEPVAALLEALVDGERQALTFGKERFGEGGHEDGVNLQHLLGGEVVAAHEDFGGAPPVAPGDAQALGELLLVVEEQPVFGAARE